MSEGGDGNPGGTGDGSDGSSPGADAVVLDGETLTPAAVERVAREDAPVRIADEARERVRESRERVAEALAADEAVYGVDTGFGDLVTERVPREQLDRLQENLVRSHAAGADRELDREEVRALLVTRCNALVTGYSGVREVVVDHLAAMLNEGVHPVVRSRGSLGASGDLAPLAHAALVLLGEGEADVDGVASAGDGADGEAEAGTDAGEDADPVVERLPGDEALARVGLEPLELAPKEGLALINGTQLTVGLAALAVRDCERLLDVADAAGALTTEVTMGSTVPSDAVVSEIRPHAGQTASAANVRRLTEGSDVVAAHRNCDRVQDAYSMRCLPQVHGAVRDALVHLREAVAVELNSATDNPLVVPADEVAPRAAVTDRAAIISAGNFHGEPLALRLDYLTEALTELAAIAERRVDRLLNPNLQEDYLPAFLAGDPGTESGLMIAQYTAASLVTELRSIGRPAADNTPVSGGQEDHVSMSATSAFATRRALEWTTTVVAIELLCATEAAGYVHDAPEVEPDDELGVGTGAVREAVRAVVPPLDGDRPPAPDVDAVRALVASGALHERLDEAIDGFERSA